MPKPNGDPYSSEWTKEQRREAEQKARELRESLPERYLAQEQQIKALTERLDKLEREKRFGDGGGLFGDDAEAEGRSWRITEWKSKETAVFADCCAMLGSVFVDFGTLTGIGAVWAKVDLVAQSCTLSNGKPTNVDAETEFAFPVCVLADGKVQKDYRGMMVAVMYS